MDEAIDRFTNFSRSLQNLCQQLPEPSPILLSSSRPSSELIDFLRNLDVGVEHGSGASVDSFVLAEKEVPKSLRDLLESYGHLRLGLLRSVLIDAAELADLDEALASWCEACGCPDLYPRVVLFSGDLEEGWVIDLSSESGEAVAPFSQDNLLGEIAESERSGEVAALAIEPEATDLREWLSARVDALIREFAAKVAELSSSPFAV